jgi:3D (Asp-Asp-Asp) domain-containing protein
VRPSVPPPAPPPAPPPLARELEVTASAYNSVAEQTDGHPAVTASGERLRPGMRALAVSDDLFESGLDFGTRVEIDGLPGEWIVMDRMHSRWRRKIDVYMGHDEAAALAFGEKKVRIRWRPGD